MERVRSKVPEGFLSLDQAAERLGITRWTATRWIEEGKLPAIRIGRRWLIATSKIPELLQIEVMGKHAAVERRGFEISSDLPVNYAWLKPISDEELEQFVQKVAELLSGGGAPVVAEGLRPIILGDEPAAPVFWRYLLAGIRRKTEPPAIVINKEAIEEIQRIGESMRQMEQRSPGSEAQESGNLLKGRGLSYELDTFNDYNDD